MSTDRELLELAAKAAGYDIRSDAWACGPGGATPALYLGNHGPAWNPLVDDGDALRLAVKLRIDIKQFLQDRGWVDCSVDRIGYGWREAVGDDAYAATRRAIVSVAAEIGRSMNRSE